MNYLLLNTAKVGVPYIIQGAITATPARYHMHDDHFFCPQYVKNLVKEKADLLGLQKEVNVKAIYGGFDIAQAHGCEASPFSCGITINDYVIPADAKGFIIAHELSHIKSNDNLTFPIMGLVVSLTTFVALTILFPLCAPFLNTSAAVGFIAEVVFSQYREAQADKSALSVCTHAEKEGALQFFTSMKLCQKLARHDKDAGTLKNFFNRCLFSETGECRLDIFHPSIESRIQMIKDSMTVASAA